jgi:LPS sulfotransferase NodH
MYSLSMGRQWVKPDHHFVIVTPGRTGSELLVDLLNSHPDIVCEPEILIERRAAPERFAAGRATKAALGGAKAYGFKIHCGHFGYQMLRERSGYLSEVAGEGGTLIFLRRRNQLAQAISSVLAGQTRWHWRRQDGGRFEPLAVDPVEVLMMLALFEESDRFVAGLLETVSHLELTYEDDLAEPAAQQATVDRICREFGLPSVPVSSDFVRLSPRRLQDTVANFDEIVELVRLTRFQRFLP